MSSTGQRRRTDSTTDDGVLYIFERNADGAVVQETFLWSECYVDMEDVWD